MTDCYYGSNSYNYCTGTYGYDDCYSSPSSSYNSCTGMYDSNNPDSSYNYYTSASYNSMSYDYYSSYSSYVSDNDNIDHFQSYYDGYVTVSESEIDEVLDAIDELEAEINSWE